jgi:hypothetical protein
VCTLVLKRDSVDTLHLASAVENVSTNAAANYRSKTSGSAWSSVTTIDSSTSYTRFYFTLTSADEPHLFAVKGSNEVNEYHKSSSWELIKEYGQFEFETLGNGDAVFDSINNIVHIVFYSNQALWHIYRYL